MKKTIILLLFIALLLISCIPIEEDDSADAADFYLTDSTGFPMSIFSPGESFYMQFYFVNTTTDTIDYTVSDSRPAVIFYIEENGERIASSIDGYGFLQVILNYKLPPGDTLMGSWLAPTTRGQDPLISLDTGQYTASAEFQGTPALDIDCVMEIVFNINE